MPCGEQRIVIVTLGNELRGDDYAGIMFGRLIGDKTGIKVFEGGASPENITGPVVNSCPDMVIVVDALDFGGTPGEMRLVPGEKLEASGISTHGSLKLFVDYIGEMTDARVLILGIQPKSLKLGEEISPEVAEKVHTITRTFIEMGAHHTLHDLSVKSI